MPAKLPDDRVRKQLIGVRCTTAERAEIEAAAGKAGVSNWIRDTVLWVARSGARSEILSNDGISVTLCDNDLIHRIYPKIPPTEPRRTWADEWAKMLQMDPMEANARLVELAAGRKFPSGFMAWSKQRRIDWLEENWKL